MMSNNLAKLVVPAVQYRDTYRAMVREFEALGEPLTPFCLQYPHDDFDALVASLRNHSRGVEVPVGFVANSTFWLVTDAEGVVAVSNLRHELTPLLRKEGGHIGYGVRPSCRRRGFGSEILRKTLREAAKLGIERVLLTCDKTNAGSIGVILNNGGHFDSEERLPWREKTVQRYWIDVEQQGADQQ